MFFPASESDVSPICTFTVISNRVKLSAIVPVSLEVKRKFIGLNAILWNVSCAMLIKFAGGLVTPFANGLFY